jgi:Arc/MetJ-type ribon-helix-helix transcriptional regulator
MTGTITFRLDEETSRAIEVLTRDGAPVSAAVRKALLSAAREQAESKLRAEAEDIVSDEADRAEAAQVLRDMETLRAW